MKLTTFILFTICFQISAAGFGQSISLTEKNATLESVFRKIEKQSGYLFWYKVEALKQSSRVDINVKNASVTQALDQALKDQPFTYSVVDNVIVVKPKSSSEKDQRAADPITVRGRVTDEKGEALPGASVRVKGTTRATSTDANGAFELRNIESNAVLTISFTGFVTKDVAVNNKIQIAVALAEQPQRLNEVVVVGYGTSRKSDLTGSVGQVNLADLQQSPVRSFDEALAGRVAGVQVVSSEGEPGSNINITIRGGNSLTQSNEPLYVIDGFPIEDPDPNLLNPADIESFDILKDASATAIYGARGANGVIIINTKRGKVGAPVIRYSGSYGIQKNIYEVPVMSPYEFVKLQNEINPSGTRTAYLGPIADTDPVQYQYTVEDYRNAEAIDWQHKLFQTAPMQNHSLSVSGGTQQTRYSISGQVFTQEGTIINTGYKRYQGKMTLDQIVNSKLKVGGSLAYTNTLKYGTSTSTANGSSMNNFLYSVWGYRPVSPLGNIDEADEIVNEDVDDIVNLTTDYRFNPIKTAQNQVRNYYNYNLRGNGYLEYSLLKELKLRVTGGIDRSVSRNEAFNNSHTYSGSPYNSLSTGVNGSIIYYESNTWLNENTLTYDKKFNKNHRLNVVGGFTFQGNHYTAYGEAANHLPNEALGLAGLRSGTPMPVTSSISDWTLASGLSRVNYTYNDKYLFTASFRADASSRFSEEHRWSYFPSAAFAWRAINEEFLKKLNVFSDAKLRLSWGITGNNRVSNEARFAQMTYPIDGYYSFNNSLVQGIVITNVGSPDLKWENTEQTDLGVDLGFLKGRIGVTVDLYRKNTRDLLLNANLPPTSGYTKAFKNIGATRNDGLEFSLNTVNIEKKNFSWSSNFNIAFNRSKVVKLSAENEESLLSPISWDSFYSAVPLYIAKVGQPVGQIYGFIWDGLYQYDDFNQLDNGTYVLKPEVSGNNNTTRANIKPGDIKFKDINGDGVVNENDRTVIGRGYPLHQGGFSNNFRFKQFDMNVFFQWSYGNDIVNANRLAFEIGNKNWLNQYATFENRWTPDNTDTDIPRAGGQFGYVYSSRIVEDGSFLRLKTVALGYTLPAKTLRSIGVKSLRVYASAQNLYTWTSYSGPDPEVSVRGGALTPGFDYSAYPRARTVALGVNLSL